jgi:DNA-binding transcriptional ArsR family regulator
LGAGLDTNKDASGLAVLSRALTEDVGDKNMDTLKILTGEEAVAAVHALNDESRRRILYALKARRMSTSELVDFLAKKDPDNTIKPQTVRYHLKELERSGLVKQDGYEPAGNGDTHILKKLWRATAENIFIATGNLAALPERPAADITTSLDIIDVMRKLGFAIPDEETLKKTAKEFVEWDSLWRRGRESAEDTLEQVSEIDPKVYVALRRILSILYLDDHDYERYWTVSRQVTDFFRKAFREGVGRNPKVY